MTVPWRLASTSGRQARVSRKVPWHRYPSPQVPLRFRQILHQVVAADPAVVDQQIDGAELPRIRAWPSRI